MKSRRKFTPEFKAKVALEALKEQQSLSELAKKFELKATQICNWKKEFQSKSALVFSTETKKKEVDDNAEMEKLYQVIGQQKVEIDFLKKALS